LRQPAAVTDLPWGDRERAAGAATGDFMAATMRRGALALNYLSGNGRRIDTAADSRELSQPSDHSI